jgi:hypothetical protein
MRLANQERQRQKEVFEKYDITSFKHMICSLGRVKSATSSGRGGIKRLTTPT